jgi:phosphate transport system substrate-binding protein
VSGSVKSIGSDPMQQREMGTRWIEGFKPSTRTSRSPRGAGSGTAPPALIAGTAQFGPMSRS